MRNSVTDPMLNKVPEVSLIFWAIKIMSTTVGETGADYLAVNAGLGVAATDLLMGTLLMLALSLQVGARRYVPWIYWLTVVLVSVVGTQITDFLTDKLEISLYVSTAVFAVALATISLFGTRANELFRSIRSLPRGVSCSIGLRSSLLSRWVPRPAILRPKRLALVSMWA